MAQFLIAGSDARLREDVRNALHFYSAGVTAKILEADTVQQSINVVTDHLGSLEGLVCFYPFSESGPQEGLILVKKTRSLYQRRNYLLCPIVVCLMRQEDLYFERAMWRQGADLAFECGQGLGNHLRFLYFQRQAQAKSGLRFRIEVENHRPTGVVLVERGGPFPLHFSPSLLVIWLFLAHHAGRWFTPQHIADELNENPYYEHFLAEYKSPRAVITGVYRIRKEIARSLKEAGKVYDPQRVIRQKQLSGNDEAYSLLAEIEWAD